MRSYYRFIFATDEILEFDTAEVSFTQAKSRAFNWAKTFSTSYKYVGIVEHEKI